MRILIAEDDPVISGYDEVEFAKRLTSDRPIEPSLEAMRWARESTAQILERLTEEDWLRSGTHSESGPYSVEDWLTIYANHGHDHAAQIKRSRGKKGSSPSMLPSRQSPSGAPHHLPRERGSDLA